MRKGSYNSLTRLQLSVIILGDGALSFEKNSRAAICVDLVSTLFVWAFRLPPSACRHMESNKLKRTICSNLLLTLLLLIVGCAPVDEKVDEKKADEPVPARVVSTISRSIVDYVELTGRTAAVESVEVRAQVSGYLDKIAFQPGAFVRKGDVLFQLDARVYQAVLEQRKSDVAAKTAELKQLEAELKRQEALIDKQATSQQQFDLALADRDKCAAELEAARANLNRAQIDLDYATVRSPIDGETSREQITVGNLVTSGATLLTSVVAVDPVYLFFDVDERTLLRFREEWNKGADEKLEVKYAIGDGEFSRVARVDFTEPRLNETTGTLEFRAVAENKANDKGLRDLIPGLRLRVNFPVTPEYDAILIPEEAVITDQNVKRVYVLGEGNTVVSTPIELGALQEDNMRVVKKGLNLGDKVIVDNLLKIKPTSIIEPIDAPSESTTRIVREDGTIINSDGTTEYDGLYEWSLERDVQQNDEQTPENAPQDGAKGDA